MAPLKLLVALHHNAIRQSKGDNMGYFIKGGGGGASNEPTYPSAPLTVAADAAGTSFVLTNTGSTPASVELSFSSDTGSQSLLIGSDYDQGTDRSPTYVIDPDTGSRTVNLKRGDLLPGDPSSSEIVTLTSNAGVLPQTITASVVLPTLISQAIRSIATPTYEFLFDGNFSNTGSIGGSSTANGGMSATSDSSTYSGAGGYGNVSGTGERHQQTIDKTTYLRLEGVDRSYINVFHIIADSSGTYVAINFATGNANTTGPGWFYKHSTNFKWDYTGGTPSSFNCDASQSHTDGGSSQELTRGAATTIIVAASWDATNETVTYRWRKTGDRAGHSFKVVTAAQNQTQTGNVNCYWSGFSSNSYNHIRLLNQSVIDATINESQFNLIAQTLNL